MMGLQADVGAADLDDGEDASEDAEDRGDEGDVVGPGEARALVGVDPVHSHTDHHEET